VSFGTFGLLWLLTLRLVGTPVGTLYVLVVVLLVHQVALKHTIVLRHFGYDWYSHYDRHTSCILVHRGYDQCFAH